MSDVSLFVLKLKKYKLMQLAVIYIRYLIGFAWVFSSIIKIEGKRFTMYDGIQAPINSAWHMFETLYQSGIYWKFIGVGQLIVGALLLSQRFSLLGALCGLPIAANIFFITISYYFANTPLITGMMLIGNIALLVWDWDKLIVLLEPKSFHYYRSESLMIYDKSWFYLGIFYFVMTVILRIFFFDFIGLILIGSIFIVIGFLVTYYNIRKYRNVHSVL